MGPASPGSLTFSSLCVKGYNDHRQAHAFASAAYNVVDQITLYYFDHRTKEVML